MKKIFTNRKFATIFLASFLTFCCGLPSQVMANYSQSVNAEQKEGIPGRRQPGGSRGCNNHTGGNLMALVPENKEVLTAAAHPQMLFHLPKTSAPMDVEFLIVDTKDNPVYETKFQTTDAGGIITVSVPESVNIEKGRKLRWYLSIFCHPNNRAHDLVVNGWITRGEINANSWQDALATLAELRRQNPNDPQLAAKWKELLEEEKLGEIAQEPLLNINIQKAAEVSFNQ